MNTFVIQPLVGEEIKIRADKWHVPEKEGLIYFISDKKTTAMFVLANILSVTLEPD